MPVYISGAHSLQRINGISQGGKGGGRNKGRRGRREETGREGRGQGRNNGDRFVHPYHHYRKEGYNA